MTLKLRVTWSNAGTPLLPESGADVRAIAGGSPLPLAARGAGLREFEIPDGTARVELKARFSASFGQVGEVSPMTREVLRVEQPYEVVDGGTALRAVDLPAYVGAHPLVDTKVVANVNGAALAQIRTDFVDITSFWMQYASESDEYLADHAPGTELVALGFTGGDPKIWFASIPTACLAPPGAGISTLVFFRPESQLYTRVDQEHAMFGLNRYLLKPIEDKNAPFWKRDVFVQPAPGGDIFPWLRCGFEDALSRSGKPVVMLHPWPSGLNYGGATSAALPSQAEAAIRFLWAAEKIAKARGGIHMGRFGLSGYSAGGLALWTALVHNLNRISEVFSFDARGVVQTSGEIIRWFNGHPGRKLRMTGGHQLTANEGIRRGIELAGGSPGARFSNLPPDEKGYLPGANPLWDHVFTGLRAEERPKLLPNRHIWHQFAAFGGFIALPGPFALTFLLRFLQESDF